MLPAWLVAGMTCKVKITTYHNQSALQIPVDLLQTDAGNEESQYVQLVDPAQDEPVRRLVTVGRRQGKMIEVLTGLKVGDKIVKKEE